MKQTSNDYSVRIYPFADDTTPESFLASMGSVNVITDQALATEQKLNGKVLFNIQLRALTRDEWQQLKDAVDAAFEVHSKGGASE